MCESNNCFSNHRYLAAVSAERDKLLPMKPDFPIVLQLLEDEIAKIKSDLRGTSAPIAEDGNQKPQEFLVRLFNKYVYGTRFLFISLESNFNPHQ